MTPDVDLLASALGSAPGRCHRLGTGGYTLSRTWRVETSGAPVFVKEAVDDGALGGARLRRRSRPATRTPGAPSALVEVGTCG